MPGVGLRRDDAVSETVGTLLQVAAVVALGSVLAVMVTASLGQPVAGDTSFSLAPAKPGDASLQVLYRNGGPLPLTSLRVVVERNGTGADAPPGTWTTPGLDALRPGDHLSLPLDPPAAPGERLRVQVVRTDVNLLAADLLVQAGSSSGLFEAPLVEARLVPGSLVADGLSAGRVEARISHPGGSLAIASVILDAGSLARAGGGGGSFLSLNDLGVEGDLTGGDGVWTTALRAPAGAAPRAYDLSLVVIDVDGNAVASQALSVQVASGGAAATEGSRWTGLPSREIRQLSLRNWTWDALNPGRVAADILVLRAMGDRTWTAEIAFDHKQGQPVVAQLALSTDSMRSVYVPRNSTLPLAGLELDLLDPVASLQMVPRTNANHPAALYANAGVTSDPVMVVAYLRDPDGKPESIGVFSVDVVVR